MSLSPEAVFARRVKLERVRAGLSQEQLALNLTESGLKIDGSAVTRIEKGQRRVRLNEADFIARRLGCSLAEFLDPQAVRVEMEKMRAGLERALEQFDQEYSSAWDDVEVSR